LHYQVVTMFPFLGTKLF